MLPDTSATARCHPDPLSIATYSTCPDGRWHEHIAPLLAAPRMVMLNIGANKGFNLVEFAQRYTEAPANLTHARWYELLMQTGCKAQCCGMCRSCKARRIRQQASASVQLHAFELQPANAHLLQQLALATNMPVVVHNTAVSNSSGTIYASTNALAGSESFGLSRDERRNHIPLPVITMDSFMQRHRIERAHFVSIDTEGEPCSARTTHARVTGKR